MKLFLFCAAIALLTPLLLASTVNSSLNKPNHQHECSSSQQATQGFPFNDLPFELRDLVLQHVSLNCLVCREWMQMTGKRRALELEAFLKKLDYFKANFNSVNVKTEVGYIESHFSTPGEMHWMASKIIAFYYDKAIESVSMKGCFVEPDSLEGFISQHIESFLKKNRLIKRLPALLLKSKNCKGLLFDVLSGNGNFQEIPLTVRKFIAKKIWCVNSHYDDIYPLSSLLSAFHDKFDMFKDALIDVRSGSIAEACVEIVLGINCTMPAVDDRMRLLGSIKLLFSEDPLICDACLLCKELSPDSPILEILGVVKKCPSIKEIAFDVLESSPEHMSAIWCMRELGKLGKLDVPGALLFNIPKHLLFNNTFLEKHQLLKEQPKLLEGCNVDNLLWNLPPNLTGLDLQALIEWVNEDEKRKKSLSFSSLVILYSLDKDAINKYSELLLKCKLELKSLYSFSTIALGVGYGRYLKDDKKLALLQILYPEKLETVKAYLDGDRKRLLFKVACLFNGDEYEYGNFFDDHLSEPDFSMLVEACLESSATCNVPPLCLQTSESAVQVLLGYIGNDVKKLSGLQLLPEYYQAMVFLLTDHDEIANYMIKSGCFTHLDWNEYFSEIRSDGKALRAAKRMHTNFPKNLIQTVSYTFH